MAAGESIELPPAMRRGSATMTSEKQDKKISRRDWNRSSIAIGLGTALASRAVEAASPRGKRRYAIVGVGSRSRMYQEAIHTTFADTSELVACCDVNLGRLELAEDAAAAMSRPKPKLYLADEFDKLAHEARAETLIVTTPCGVHDQHICRAMELGMDVITEKAMTTEAAKCQRIIDVRRKTRRKCMVAFNYRYTPFRSQLKELLIDGLIGEVLSVDFHWVLDTHHGADYFRRWHSLKRFSGGLLVHKATHHFDLVNWWLSSIPVKVEASGARAFYTPEMAKRLGLERSHERCHTCPEKAKCAFELDLAKDPELKSLYLDNERYDGYFRDRCVFRPEIEIEDTMSVNVSYETGASLTYSLNAFSGWEGYVVAFNGTLGRIEHRVEERVSLDLYGKTQDALPGDGTYIRVYPLRKPAYGIEPRVGPGDHSGGDPLMLADLFATERGPDKLLRAADETSGAYSVLVGAAANESIKTGRPVRIATLIKNLDPPAYPKMPGRRDPVSMPPKVERPQG